MFAVLARALDTPEIALSLKLTDPQDVIVLKGQSATLRCDAVSYLNDLQPADRIAFHFADFLSVGETGWGPALDITRSPSNQAIPEFQPALLNCSIHSTPPAEIQWEFNNKPLPQNTSQGPTRPNFQLHDNGDSWTLYTHSKTENSIYVNNEEVNSTNGTDAVPSVPEQLEGTPDSPTSIRLIWGDVANKKHYVVCYVPIREGGRCEGWKVGQKVGAFQVQLCCLTSNRIPRTNLKVQTHNLEGISGPFSKSIEVHTPPD
ncbi:hypothetical protein NQ318_012791, partial [Aromia moschata]